MNVFLNGQRHDVEAQTVADLVGELRLVPETILVEHNGSALLRSEWAHTTLSNEDQLEVLRVAAGG
jgi:thiamine biosynthesis protein ThiS